MKCDPFPRRILRAAAATALLATVTSSAFAATAFQGPGTNWVFTEHWSGGLPTAATDYTYINSHNVVLGASNGANPYYTGGQFDLTGGSLNIYSNGRLQSGHVNIGAAAGQTASVTLNDPGAAWTTSDDIGVGNGGNGTLTLKNGANLSVASYGLFVAYQPGSVGTLNIGDYAGGTTGGNLTLTGASGITGGIHIGSGSGTINFNQTDTFTLAAPIDGAGTLVQRGTGTTVLTRDNTSFTGTVTVSAGTLQIGAGGTTGSIPGNITNNANLSFNHNSDTSYTGVISGSGAVTKLGSGRLTLTGTNTYSGGTTINAGTLMVGNNGTTGSVSGNIINSSHLLFNRSNDFTYAGVISGGGFVSKFGAGTLTLTGNNTYTGGTTIYGGTLLLETRGALATNGPVTISSGALVLGFSDQTIGSLSGSSSFASINLNNAGLTLNQSTSETYAGSISGTGGQLIKLGQAILTLTGNATHTGGTFTGATVISAGTLQVGNGGTSGSITGNITNNANLVFDRSNDSSYPGVISGSGAVTKQGSGMLTFAGANTYSGGTTVNAGTLRLSAIGALAADGPVTLNGSGLLLAADQTIGTLSGNAASSIDFGNHSLTLNQIDDATYAGSISGTGGQLIKDNSGVLKLTGNITLTSGTILISHGALQIGNANASGSVSGNITNNAFLLFTRNDDSFYSGVISGSGSVIKSGLGKLTLTANHPYSGLTTISSGTLQVGNGGLSGSISGNVTNKGTLIFSRSDSITFDKIVDGTGMLTKAGTGTLILTGANAFSGGTTVAAGTLQLGNSGLNLSDLGAVHVSSGTLALGASAETIGSLAVDNQGALAFDLPSAGSYERLIIANGVTLTGGTLRLTLTNGYVPSAGATFDLLDWGGTLTGTFTTLDLPVGVTWDTSNLYTNGTVVAVPEPATLSLFLPGAIFLCGVRRRKNLVGYAAV